MVTPFVTGIRLGFVFCSGTRHRPTSMCNPNTTHVLRLLLMLKLHVLLVFCISLCLCRYTFVLVAFPFVAYDVYVQAAFLVHAYMSSLTFLLVLLTPRCPAHVQLWCIYGRSLRGRLKNVVMD